MRKGKSNKNTIKRKEPLNCTQNLGYKIGGAVFS